MSILVVGAGIMGMSTALKLRHAGYSVVLYAKSYPKDSTSNGAGGFWMPFHCEPQNLVDKWAEQTLKSFFELRREGDTVVEYMKCALTIPTGTSPPLPTWASFMDGVLNFKTTETSAFGLNIPGVEKLFVWDGFVIDCERYLERALKVLEEDEGVQLKLGQPAFASLPAVVEYARNAGCVGVVNCIGSGAEEVCNDSSLTPGRGVILNYARPADAKMVILSEASPLSSETHPAYVIPRGGIVVCGGTYIEDSWDEAISAEEGASIKHTSGVLCPSLKDKEPVSTWVGFRPVRKDGVRFEEELCSGMPVFHNYGHGGSGWTIFEGATAETVENIKARLPRRQSKH